MAASAELLPETGFIHHHHVKHISYLGYHAVHTRICVSLSRARSPELINNIITANNSPYGMLVRQMPLARVSSR
jgi:hypothetical protein